MVSTQAVGNSQLVVLYQVKQEDQKPVNEKTIVLLEEKTHKIVQEPFAILNEQEQKALEVLLHAWRAGDNEVRTAILGEFTDIITTPTMDQERALKDTNRAISGYIERAERVKIEFQETIREGAEFLVEASRIHTDLTTAPPEKKDVCSKTAKNLPSTYQMPLKAACDNLDSYKEALGFLKEAENVLNETHKSIASEMSSTEEQFHITMQAGKKATFSDLEKARNVELRKINREKNTLADNEKTLMQTFGLIVEEMGKVADTLGNKIIFSAKRERMPTAKKEV